MDLTSFAAEKADASLRDALSKAVGDESIRVVFTLGGEPLVEVMPPAVGRKSYSVRSATPRRVLMSDRRALIEERKRRFDGAFGALKQSLVKRGLRVSGGEMTRAVVVEGAADDVAASLELPQVARAILDQTLEMPRVTNKCARADGSPVRRGGVRPRGRGAVPSSRPGKASRATAARRKRS